MDDYIPSLPTVAEAKTYISKTKDCPKIGGFRLTMFVPNKPEVLAEISADDKDEKRDNETSRSKIERNN